MDAFEISLPQTTHYLNAIKLAYYAKKQITKNKLTSLLLDDQINAQCIRALSIMQAAGERVRSGEGISERCSGKPRQYPF